MDSQSSGGAFKRKPKRMSTYQRAVKFSKRGKFGHGFQIQDEDFQYFLNILKVSKETFESSDDKCKYCCEHLDLHVCELCLNNFYTVL
jgi:hypothetical protein